MSSPIEKRHPASRAASPAPSAASIATRRSAKSSAEVDVDVDVDTDAHAHGPPVSRTASVAPSSTDPSATTTPHHHDDDGDDDKVGQDTAPAAALTATLPAQETAGAPDAAVATAHPSSALPPHMLQEAGIHLSSASGSASGSGSSLAPQSSISSSSSSNQDASSPISILSPLPSKPSSIRSSISRPDSPGTSSVTFVDPVGGSGGGGGGGSGSHSASHHHPTSKSSLRASSTASSTRTRSPSSEPRGSIEGGGGDGTSTTDVSSLRSAMHRISIDDGVDEDSNTNRNDAHPISAHTAPASTSRSRKPKTRILSEGESLISSSRYERKVGFDTMPDADETNSGSFSFTLQLRSQGYRRTRGSRTFMCCVDNNHYSERALEWLMDSLVEDGDEIVALRVLEGEAEEIDQAAAREDARELLASIVQLNEEVRQHHVEDVVGTSGGGGEGGAPATEISSPTEMEGLESSQSKESKVEAKGKDVAAHADADANSNPNPTGARRINVVVEFVAGKVEPTILRLIHMYRPCSLSVGTRGRTVSAFHKMLGGGFVGSTSRDILASSPVPVVVIRPEAKVQKHLSKRSNNPKRPRSYHELVAKVPEEKLPMSLSGGGGGGGRREKRKSAEWGWKLV